MSETRLRLLWLCGGVLSAACFSLGIEREYVRLPEPEHLPASTIPEPSESESESPAEESRSWVEAYIVEWKHNLYLVLLAPALILSACTLATVLGKRRDKS